MATLTQTFSYTTLDTTASVTATVNYSVDNDSDKTKTKITVSSVTVGTVSVIGTHSASARGTLLSSYLHIYLPNGVDINNVVQLSYYINATTPINVTKSYTRGHSSGSQRLGLYIGSATVSAQNKYIDITVPARPAYTVSYNLNGGTGTIPSQTKWYAETLTLTTAKPTKSGYTFKGWATTLANAQAGNANQGTTYTANASTTFYAVWELIYSKPTIKNVTVERCLQDGSLDDEGDYASVYFEWKVFKSSLARYYGGNTYPYANNSVSNCTITVGTQTLTPTLSVAEGGDSFVVGSGTFELDTAYDATISITDSQTIVANHTTTAGGTLPTAFFPMDFNADASAVGFFMSAPDAGDGAYFGKDVHVFVDTSTATSPDGDITQALTDLGWTDVLS